MYLLYCINWIKTICKWTCTFQACIVQGSAVFIGGSFKGQWWLVGEVVSSLFRALSQWAAACPPSMSYPIWPQAGAVYGVWKLAFHSSVCVSSYLLCPPPSFVTSTGTHLMTLWRPADKSGFLRAESCFPSMGTCSETLYTDRKHSHLICFILKQ